MNNKDRIKRFTFYKDTSLLLAMFFLPFGYDFLFKLIMDATGSYWAADIAFYCLSGSFWLSFIYWSRYINNTK
jgi:hypothetical protein